MAVKSWSTAHRKVEVPVRTLAYVRRTASALCIVIFQVEKSHQFSHWEPVMKLESHSELALVADREIRTCLSKAVGLDLNEKKSISEKPAKKTGHKPCERAMAHKEGSTRAGTEGADLVRLAGHGTGRALPAPGSTSRKRSKPWNFLEEISPEDKGNARECRSCGGSN